MSDWYMYVVRCSDDTLYTGVTNDVTRRVNDHNHSKRGAKYTKARRPVSLEGFQSFASQSEACRAEAAFKKLPRQKKLKQISEW